MNIYLSCFKSVSAYPDASKKPAAVHNTIVIVTATSCSGIALRISFSTPEGEVYGVAPVKFIATYELTLIVR